MNGLDAVEVGKLCHGVEEWNTCRSLTFKKFPRKKIRRWIENRVSASKVRWDTRIVPHCFLWTWQFSPVPIRFRHSGYETWAHCLWYPFLCVNCGEWLMFFFWCHKSILGSLRKIFLWPAGIRSTDVVRVFILNNLFIFVFKTLLHMVNTCFELGQFCRNTGLIPVFYHEVFLCCFILFLHCHHQDTIIVPNQKTRKCCTNHFLFAVMLNSWKKTNSCPRYLRWTVAVHRMTQYISRILQLMTYMRTISSSYFHVGNFMFYFRHIST